MNSKLINVSAKQLRQAADLKEKIDGLQSELNRILGSPAEPAVGPTAPKKRRMSQAAIAKIRAAAKARWAKIRGKTTAKPAQHPKRKMSAAAKARLSAIAKARWKKARAAGKTAL